MITPKPKLRTVSGVKEPYPLGSFPKRFVHSIVGEIYAASAVGRKDIVGKEWEEIFAKAVGAKWKPSNVGLDDILMKKISAVWGAKTIKNNNPFNAKIVRLISGRNSLDHSYHISDPRSETPKRVGELVLGIWNDRVASLYQKYSTLRTVVLLKGPELRKISVFEMETVRYDSLEFSWSWNKGRNLVGKTSEGKIKFTWQPSGSQFTIHERVPDNALNIEIDSPPKVSIRKILKNIKFSTSNYRIKT